ncbi:MAG: FeoB-associated Cys-rich membrane protein [Flavobacterium sp.]|uniref:FeoB-associated Cys-rich membrane protein n=1 Tax=Flavobacterium macrobrachii TaxID=591204 RepID=A0ABS2CYN4_9FLAO|nr:MULTISPECIES: FeoB-associated Cys-rich membrane protein [Flavobacterium]MBM6500019.1 FeoB-associated Cys-rich membrane protein [Flavobacterium macrobrachii]MCZ8089788.1 FeoB-associated Cys-rich membrane protein [Flavobacterium sp.]MCZ8329677.1 FeoB-associated Cys-rich membrane protein [Flavobacterium sp.]PZO29274.1 MAG: FeoB-associated Cys-rich membrane protein [Flavobacteriaceae bacterium]
MDFQEILVYILVIVALGFLVRKFFWKSKSKKNCGNGDCGCS